MRLPLSIDLVCTIFFAAGNLVCRLRQKNAVGVYRRSPDRARIRLQGALKIVSWYTKIDNFENNVYRDCLNPQFLYRSEEHTSELQSLMRISYAVFCLKKKKDIREIT